ncbi:hypothetical protein ACF1AX_21490 [Streptomyces sp. NPDC014802]|uniref:hypothetical protein n=1 Tax=Streptomyces sp. NPDC014802 TaxID=3364917 RepID=UPI000EB67975|nr:hypothetical protein SEA_TRVXSCOTT_79 [Streptomyces phage TrvxScott]
MSEVRSRFALEATDKGGLTYGELKKLLATIEDASDVDDDAPIRVKVGWKSQILKIEIG